MVGFGPLSNLFSQIDYQVVNGQNPTMGREFNELSINTKKKINKPNNIKGLLVKYDVFPMW